VLVKGGRLGDAADPGEQVREDLQRAIRDGEQVGERPGQRRVGDGPFISLNMSPNVSEFNAAPPVGAIIQVHRAAPFGTLGPC
jgi:hypothetical protein